MIGWLERGFLRAFGVRAFRCEACDERFYKFAGGHYEKPMEMDSTKTKR